MQQEHKTWTMQKLPQEFTRMLLFPLMHIQLSQVSKHVN